MAPLSPIRLLPGLLYAGFLLFAAGWLVGRVYAFQGQILLPLGGTERVAVCAPGASGWTPGMWQSAPVEAIPFESPPAPADIPRDTLLDAVQLPFQLRLVRAGALESDPPPQRIVLEFEGRQHEFVAEAGIPFGMGGIEFLFQSTAPWKGIAESPQGQPMALVNLSTELDGLGKDVVLNQGQWVQPTPALSVFFEWQPAQRNVPSSLAPETGARWGIQDAGRILWLQSLVPGTGATLANGAEATLIEMATDGQGLPVLDVALIQSGARSKVTVPANFPEPVSGIVFTCPALYPEVVMLQAIDAQKMHVSVYTELALMEEKVLGIGGGIQIGGQWLRVDDFFASAVAIATPQEDIWEAILRTSTRVLRVREGETETVDGVRVTYERDDRPPRVECLLEARWPDGRTREIELQTGESTNVGTWQLQVDQTNAHPEKQIVLNASRARGRMAKWLGGAMFCAGIVGCVVVRFAVRAH